MIYETLEHKCWRARFDGEGSKRLGMAADFNPFPAGGEHDAWAEGWESIPRWRRTEFRHPVRALGEGPAPRPCPDPDMERQHWGIGYG